MHWAVVRQRVPVAVGVLFFSAGELGRESVLLFDSYGQGTTNKARLEIRL